MLHRPASTAYTDYLTKSGGKNPNLLLCFCQIECKSMFCFCQIQKKTHLIFDNQKCNTTTIHERHSALSRLMSDPEYEFPRAFVFSDKASKTEGRISYLPIYLLSFLKQTSLPEKMIFEI